MARKRTPKADSEIKLTPNNEPTAEQAVDIDSSSDEGQPRPESDQRLPENLEQAATAPEPTDNNGADDDASNAASPPATPPEQKAAPLFAVEMVNLAGKYYEPGVQLEESQIAKDEAAIPVLLAAGAIREG